MTFFDPHIFCKQNLKEEDRRELDHWEEIFDQCIEQASMEYSDDTILEKIQKEVVDDFISGLKMCIGYALQQHVINAIENYKEEVEDVENPETYYYEEMQCICRMVEEGE